MPNENKDTLLDELRDLSKDGDDAGTDDNQDGGKGATATGSEETSANSTSADQGDGGESTDESESHNEEAQGPSIIDQYLDGEMDSVVDIIHQKVVDAVKTQMDSVADLDVEGE